MMKNFLLFLLCALSIFLIAGCQKKSGVIDFYLCTNSSESGLKGECKERTNFHADASIFSHGIRPGYNGSSLTTHITLPNPKGALPYSYENKPSLEVEVGFGEGGLNDERFDAIYDLHLHTFHERVVNEPRGDLLVVSESRYGATEGYEYLIPKNGAKNIWFQCMKPWKTTSGKIITDVYCKVRSESIKHVFLRYDINANYMPRWQEATRAVDERVKQALFFQPNINQESK